MKKHFFLIIFCLLFFSCSGEKKEERCQELVSNLESQVQALRTELQESEKNRETEQDRTKEERARAEEEQERANELLDIISAVQDSIKVIRDDERLVEIILEHRDLYSESVKAGITRNLSEIRSRLSAHREQLQELQEKELAWGEENETFKKIIESLDQELQAKEICVTELEALAKKQETIIWEIEHKNQNLTESLREKEEKLTRLARVYYKIGTESDLKRLGIVSTKRRKIFLGLLKKTKVFTRNKRNFDTGTIYEKEIFLGYGIRRKDVKVLTYHRKKYWLYSIVRNGSNETVLRIRDREFWDAGVLVVRIKT